MRKCHTQINGYRIVCVGFPSQRRAPTRALQRDQLQRGPCNEISSDEGPPTRSAPTRALQLPGLTAMLALLALSACCACLASPCFDACHCPAFLGLANRCLLLLLACLLSLLALLTASLHCCALRCLACFACLACLNRLLCLALLLGSVAWSAGRCLLCMLLTCHTESSTPEAKTQNSKSSIGSCLATYCQKNICLR